MSGPFIVDPESAPGLCSAMRQVEKDNGGHLIGTFYPGEEIDLNRFEIPSAWAHLVPAAEAGLFRLMADSPEDFETFTTGEFTDIEMLRVARGDLDVAQRLLADWFNGWMPLEAPALPVEAAS